MRTYLSKWNIHLRLRATVSSWIIHELMSCSSAQATDYWGQLLQFHTNQHHFLAYLDLSWSQCSREIQELDHHPHNLDFCHQIFSPRWTCWVCTVDILITSSKGQVLIGQIFPLAAVFMSNDHFQLSWSGRSRTCRSHTMLTQPVQAQLFVSAPAPWLVVLK